MVGQQITVTFQPSGKRSQIAEGKTILDAARLCGEFIPSVCGGRGKCGKCVISVPDPDSVRPPSGAELDLLGSDGDDHERLACLTLPRRDLIVEIPPKSREASPDILVEGLDYEITLDPIVTKHHLKMSAPTLDDPVADFERLRRSLSELGIEVSEEGWQCLERGPEVLREANWDVTASLWSAHRLIRIQPGDKTYCAVGAAIDVGTTTLVCYLVDLLTGETLASDSALNPQIPYGEDVVTRLAFQTASSKNGTKLHQLVIGEISRLISRCCRKIGVCTTDVLDVCIAGNTVMHHIALGLPTKYLGVSPFTPVVRNGVDTTAEKVGLKLHADTPVHALPTLAGYVGADTTGVILASRIYEAEDLSMAIDIGTNGEIVLGDSRGLTVCSCAAGPALEGAHIKFGMRAARGAIQRVKIDGDRVQLKTIGGGPPVGIAGAGIIDAVAEMFRTGVIGPEGRFRDHPQVRTRNGMKEFVLTSKDETGLDTDIVMTQKDIREVQLAKAAIYTGAASLLEEEGKDIDDVSTLFIAGAFGNFIDFQSAKLVGLIPDIEMDRFKFIGNGAAAGAKLALLSKSLREVAEHLAGKVEYVELTCTPNFTKNYMDATYLPHRDPGRFASVEIGR